MKTTLISGAAVLALTTGMSVAQSLEFPIGEGEFNWDSYQSFADSHDLSGQSMDITGPWTGADDALFSNVIAYFEEATGASVNYSGSDSFEQDIVISTEANSAPNIAVFPQPGLIADLARRGEITPLGEETSSWIAENYAAGDSWVDLATFSGPDGEELFAFPYKIDVKSLVWYVPEQFEEAGYEIPESYEELKELTQQMADDGVTPWCIGLGSGAATGWPATDWVEDLMLRTASPETYDQWVSNEIPFDDPAVVNAIEEYGYFSKNDDFVNGGAAAVATIDFRDAPSGLFSFPPECYMLKQATFIPTFFPEGTELGTDADFFYFPASSEEDLGQPVLGAGTMFAITEDSEAAQAFIEFLQTPIAHELWMAQSGFLTPFTEANAAVFPTDAQRSLNEILTDATTFRFDASDLMPGEIGAGAFWTGMVDFQSGSDAESVAAAIQNRWDQLN
ncbi:alpha-glucoside transport system substrate-binding protein [Palleronia aestuarii]|uniref:Alpha-glucoside transport system substrate-binding protein n=1 Tax=Palleronia aestuarii TaxID=568105 RepID=A0A2W7NH51_9RHOB|nr:ABC transporter substrate-binding protein [Palleronia aestuarii]PZX17527.1 alpha-glucoside transport system substrate-binding protein [Palleronia aestuarii]